MNHDAIRCLKFLPTRRVLSGRITRSLLAASALALCISGLVGCTNQRQTTAASDVTSRPPATAPAPAAATPNAGAPAVAPDPVAASSSASAQAPSTLAKDLLPLAPRSVKFVVTEGKDVGKSLTHTIAQTAKGWEMSTQDVSVVRLQIDDKGDLLVTEEEDLDENVLVAYEPALRALPAKLAAGETSKQTVRMTVFNRRTHKVRDEGSCEITVEFVATRPVQTPAGAITATVVKTTRHIKLGLAEATVTMHSAYQAGHGVIVDRVEQHTRAVGLFTMNKTLELRLAK
jgi:hypothetical protein